MAKSIEVKAPIGGVSLARGYQDQPPFPSVLSENFLPFDARSGRRVSAVRPALQALATPLATGVNMLARLHGDASQSPSSTIIATEAGNVHFWNGAGWTESTYPGADTVTTGRRVFGNAFLKDMFIMNDTNTLVYNYDSNTTVKASTLITTAIPFPVDCRMAVAWQGGLWIAGQLSTPHIIYGSRSGDAFDWDSGVEDTGGAFAMTGENSGLIGRAVTALMPYSLDTMFVGTEDTISIFRGHPRRGGVFEQVSGTQGVLGQGAWCMSPNNTLYFLSKSGLCSLTSAASPVTIVSKGKIPDFLIALDYDQTAPTVSLAYDVRWDGVIITVEGTAETGQSWWFDPETGGFHRMIMDGYPLVLLHDDRFAADATSGVLWSSDNYGGLATLNTNGTESFNYRLAVGPIRISKGVTEQSIITRSTHVMTGNSEGVAGDTINIWTGATSEDVYRRLRSNINQTRYSQATSSLITNNGRGMPRKAGASAIIEIFGTSGSASNLAYEMTELELEPAGRNRMAAKFLPAAADKAPVFAYEGWDQYATASVPVASLVEDGFIHFVDLSTLPDSWWTNVNAQSAGQDVRVSTSFNNLMPHDLIQFDQVAKTGCVAFRMSSQFQDLGDREVRIWNGNSTVAAFATGNDNGQFAVYDEDVEVCFTPGSGGLGGGGGGTSGVDRTAQQHTFSTIQNPPDINFGGGVSVFGMPLDAATSPSSSIQYDYTIGNITVAGATRIEYTKIKTYTDASATHGLQFLKTDASPTVNQLVVGVNTTASTYSVKNFFDFGSLDYDITHQTAFALNTLRQIALTAQPTTGNHKLLIDGVANTTPPTDDFVITTTHAGDAIVLNSSAGNPTADVGFLMYFNVAKADSYLLHQYNMLDQVTFYGSWSVVQN